MNALEIRDLTIAFGGARRFVAAESVSLSVAPGETFGLIGPSGCGKTTVLRAVAGLNPHWQGAISVFGDALVPGRKITGKLRGEIQMVFQDPYSSLHPRHSIGHTLGEPLAIRHIGDIDAKVAQALDQVGLDPAVAGRFPISCPADSANVSPSPARCF